LKCSPDLVSSYYRNLGAGGYFSAAFRVRQQRKAQFLERLSPMAYTCRFFFPSSPGCMFTADCLLLTSCEKTTKRRGKKMQLGEIINGRVV